MYSGTYRNAHFCQDEYSAFFFGGKYPAERKKCVSWSPGTSARPGWYQHDVSLACYQSSLAGIADARPTAICTPGLPFPTRATRLPSHLTSLSQSVPRSCAESGRESGPFAETSTSNVSISSSPVTVCRTSTVWMCVTLSHVEEMHSGLKRNASRMPAVSRRSAACQTDSQRTVLVD